MKKYKLGYCVLFLGVLSCSKNNDIPNVQKPNTNTEIETETSYIGSYEYVGYKKTDSAFYVGSDTGGVLLHQSYHDINKNFPILDSDYTHWNQKVVLLKDRIGFQRLTVNDSFDLKILHDSVFAGSYSDIYGTIWHYEGVISKDTLTIDYSTSTITISKIPLAGYGPLTRGHINYEDYFAMDRPFHSPKDMTNLTDSVMWYNAKFYFVKKK